ncbi:MAG: saccharopine dehydrogenase NADP-binding domain-containing protein [Pseudomonadota bacterium]
MKVQSILIAGGYGVVGAEIAHLVRKHYPEVEILLAGRNPRVGDQLADQLGFARTVALDTSDLDPLGEVTKLPDLILAVVNDHEDQLMLSCVRRGIAYIDVTRWTERMRSAIERLDREPSVRAPVVFSSSWMASVAATVAAGFAREFSNINRIDVGILYAQEDRAGPNSVEYMDRMHLPFEVVENGQRLMAKPFRAAHKTEFPGTGTYKLYRFDTPDQFTLPSITNAKSVAARIGFDDAISGPLLSGMVKSGIWRLISGRAFTGLRHGLLFNPGKGAPHRVRIDISGETSNSGHSTRSWLIVDFESQTHMTAMGALIQIDRLMREKEGVEPGGVQIAEAVTDLNHCLQLLEENGVAVTEIL